MLKNLIRLFIILLTGTIGLPVAAQVNTDQVIRIGQNALYFEDYMLSIQYFNQAIQAKPYLAKPYFLRSVAKLNLEDYAGAEADASKAIELNPFLTDAWEARGVARQNLGRDRDAVGDYRHALELLPRNRQIMFNMALAQQQIKSYEEADSTFEELLRYYPNFANGYLGRARLRLEQADTTAANADIDKALSINRNLLNAYVMRADIAINSQRDYAAALNDMNEAIKLQPRMTGLYINRAFLRYNLDDYFGAMADYDHAIELDPLNSTALFNRGLLLAEVNANDRALVDFSKVLDLNPDDYRALYNRAVIYGKKADYKAATDDINRVIDAFPDFPGAVYLRGEFARLSGNLYAAKKDFDKAMALAKAATPNSEADKAAEIANRNGGEGKDADVPSELVSKRFASLLTVDNNARAEEEYNNSAIRGHVQDRNLTIELQPIMELSYYSSPSELRPGTYYIKEVDDLNTTRMLRFVIVVTNALPYLDEDTFDRHFQSIEYYNSYIATHSPRAIDYIGRALDFMTVRDYDAACRDIAKALELTPDYPLAYLLDAQADYHRYELLNKSGALSSESSVTDPSTRAQFRRKMLDDALEGYTKAIELSPRMAPAWYNKGNVLVEMQNYQEAIDAYTHAIELKEDMGEAYFNRGYVYLKLGDRRAGIADLSKAGELGIIGAYNLIKRISN